jgi:tripartite-type tricarboxylate transporter receptor subunit TctC
MVRPMLRGAAAAALSILMLGLYTPAQAQSYPTKNVNLIVSIGPGTGMDVLARLYAEKLAQSLGRPVVVENKPGAATMLAATHVAQSEPDGHTMVILTSSALAINQHLYKKLNYNPETDFTPISLYVKSPLILAVNPKLPIKDVKEFIAHAKKAKPAMTYASVGAGGFQHITMEFAKQRFGFEATHVPYRNTGQSVADMMAGHVDSGFVEAGASIPSIKEGKLRALAVSSLTELPLLPGVPPFAQAAGVPDFESVSWHALMVPSKTPKPVVERLHAEMKKIMSDPTMIKRASDIGLIPFESPSVDGINDYIKAERTKWGKLVDSIGLRGSQ